MNSNTRHLFPLAVLTFAAAIAVCFVLSSGTKAGSPSVTADAASWESRHMEQAATISADDEPQVVSLEVNRPVSTLAR